MDEENNHWPDCGDDASYKAESVISLENVDDIEWSDIVYEDNNKTLDDEKNNTKANTTKDDLSAVSDTLDDVEKVHIVEQEKEDETEDNQEEMMKSPEVIAIASSSGSSELSLSECRLLQKTN